jgi:hypothetical protein
MVMGIGVGCVSTPDIKDHNACFLMQNAAIRNMNILSPLLSRDGFKHYLKLQVDAGANCVYLYTMNEKDGGWTPYSIYKDNQIGGTVNDHVVKEMQWRIEECRKEGLAVVIVMRADDSPNFNRAELSAIDEQENQWIATQQEQQLLGVTVESGNQGEAYHTSSAQQTRYNHDCVKHFDDYASAYWIGLEVDEYYDKNTTWHYANQMQGLTDKEIGTHQTFGWDYAAHGSVDAAWVQTGFGRDPAYIQNLIAQARAALPNKRVYCAEYDKSSRSAGAKARGDAGMAGGAHGTGNNRNNPPDVDFIDKLLGWLSTIL